MKIFPLSFLQKKYSYENVSSRDNLFLEKVNVNKNLYESDALVLVGRYRKFSCSRFCKKNIDLET